MFRIDQLFIIRGYFTVYAAYGIYNAENILTLCKTTYIQGVTGGTDQTSGECSLGQTISI